MGLIDLCKDHLNIKSVKNILEIGARECSDSIQYANEFPSAQIFAFEPNPNQVDQCAINASKNSRVHFYPMAALCFNGMVEFYPTKEGVKNVGVAGLYPFDMTNDFVQYGGFANSDPVLVPCIRIDDWRKKENIGPIDIVELDAQASEYFVLLGMLDTLKDVKVIKIEINVAPYYQTFIGFDKVNNLLLECGFKLVNSLTNENRARYLGSVGLEDLEEKDWPDKNYLFKRK